MSFELDQLKLKQEILVEALRVDEARKAHNLPFAGFRDGTECPVAIPLESSESGFGIAKVDGNNNVHLAYCGANTLSEARKMASRVRTGKLPSPFNW